MSKWIDLETDASTGKPYLWKCDECGEEVETKWNYCPECGDPKTSKGKRINTLVEALEAEHKRLKELQNLATDKNVGSKYDELEIVRAISGLTEWQKHVQTDSNIDRDITVAIEALKAQLGTNLAEVGADTISRQAVKDLLNDNGLPYHIYPYLWDKLNGLPSSQPEVFEWCDTCKEYDQEKHCCHRFTKVIRDTVDEIKSERSEIIFCKDCRKHNVKVGFDENFHTVWKEDACPLVDWRGKAQGHEFDYQYCAYAERRTDG